ncbi:MAG: DUF1565 domain-containing protein [Chloroflexi bacterium]|nr:DUF1565 domain-containing protein [Chloroflexota bacterium]
MAAPSGVERGKRGPANLFVSSSTGDDSNTGTKRTEPLRSIKAAMLRAKPGSTITLLPGWYEGGIVLPPGTEGRPLTLRAERRGRVFIGRPRILSGFQRAEGWEYTYHEQSHLFQRSLWHPGGGLWLQRRLNGGSGICQCEKLVHRE